MVSELGPNDDLAIKPGTTLFPQLSPSLGSSIHPFKTYNLTIFIKIARSKFLKEIVTDPIQWAIGTDRLRKERVATVMDPWTNGDH